MLLPVGQSISVPVEIMCPTAEPPVHVAGLMTLFQGDVCKVQIAAPAPRIELGSRAVISVNANGGMRILGVVTAKEAEDMSLEIIRVVRKDKRDYPRMFGGIELRYRVIPELEMPLAERAWMNGLSGVSDEHPWHEPDPFMNFSGSGIRFRDNPSCAAGDLLLVEMKVPTATKWFRATGTVVRVEKINVPQNKELPDERDHFVAVQFRTLPPEAVEALTRFTLDLQLQAMSNKK